MGHEISIMMTLGSLTVLYKSWTVSRDEIEGRERVEGSHELCLHHFSQDLRILTIDAGLFNVNSSILIGYLGD